MIVHVELSTMSSMLDTVVISGEDVCCNVCTLVGECVFSVMWSELLITSVIGCLLWSPVYECQSVGVRSHLR